MASWSTAVLSELWDAAAEHRVGVNDQEGSAYVQQVKNCETWLTPGGLQHNADSELTQLKQVDVLLKDCAKVLSQEREDIWLDARCHLT